MIRRTIFATSALMVCALNAQAQSSVTLYGLVDTGILYNSNSSGKTAVSMTTNNISGNRWGLKGNEDLGGGLSALFVTEGGFYTTTGGLAQGGALFGRQVYLGLAGRFGKATLGRQYDPLAESLSVYPGATSWASVYEAHPADLDNLNATKRTNNSIKYRTPDWKGISMTAMYSLGGQPGSLSRDSVWSVAVNYRGGPLSVGAALLVARNPNYSYWGTNGNANTPTSTTTALNNTSPIISGYASARTQQTAAAAASYRLGGLTVSVVVSDTRLKDIGSEPGKGLNPRGIEGGEAVFDTAELGVTYQFTPSLIAGVAYHITATKSPVQQPNARYNQLSLGTGYFLSKSTDLYALATYQRASGVDSTGMPARAALASLGSVSSNSKQGIILIGMRHRF